MICNTLSNDETVRYIVPFKLFDDQNQKPNDSPIQVLLCYPTIKILQQPCCEIQPPELRGRFQSSICRAFRMNCFHNETQPGRFHFLICVKQYDTWWRHQRFPRYWSFVRGIHRGDRWIPRTKASDAELWCFLWSAPWMNGWVNNREAGDLRHHRAHYDVTIMILLWVSPHKKLSTGNISSAVMLCTPLYFQ